MGYDTSFSALGSTIQTSEIDDGAVTDQKLSAAFNQIIASMEIEIIEIQAASTIAPFTFDTMITDTFYDSNGYANSVTLASTTATYDSSGKKYKWRNVNTTNDTNLITPDAPGGTTGKEGVKIHCNANCSLYQVTVDGQCAATKCYLWDASKGEIANTTTLNGSTFTFSPTQNLTSGTNYYIVVDKAGAGYNEARQTGTYPQNKTNVNWIGGLYNTTQDNTTTFSNIETITTNITNTDPKIIDITLGTITGTVIATELVVNYVDTEGDSSATYKLKNATENQASLAVNTQNNLSGFTSNPTGMEINLNPKSASPTDGYPSVKSYCLKIWKS